MVELGMSRYLLRAREDDRDFGKNFFMRLYHEVKRRFSNGDDQVRLTVSILANVPGADFLLGDWVREQIRFQILAIQLDLERRSLQRNSNLLIQQFYSGRGESHIVKDQDAPHLLDLGSRRLRPQQRGCYQYEQQL